MKVFLDDKRETPNGWIRVYTANEAIELLLNGQVEEISLDHDIGIEEEVGNGYKVLKWIEEQVHTTNYKPPIMTVHSDNAPARLRMELAIRSINEFVERKGE